MQGAANRWASMHAVSTVTPRGFATQAGITCSCVWLRAYGATNRAGAKAMPITPRATLPTLNTNRHPYRLFTHHSQSWQTAAYGGRHTMHQVKLPQAMPSLPKHHGQPSPGRFLAAFDDIIALNPDTRPFTPSTQCHHNWLRGYPNPPSSLPTHNLYS